jgi:hypothetical protein
MASTLALAPEAHAASGAGASAELHARIIRPDFEQWLRGAGNTGGCARPVRLVGTVHTFTADGSPVDVLRTAQLPDQVLFKACGDRREHVCPACSKVYRADAFQILRAGLAGGHGIPETVTTHPCVFLTLTAPSFGLVHTRRTAADGRALPCRPRRKAERCEHGRSLSCGHTHADGEKCLGAPLCPDCYDYTGQVAWNGFASVLWRRTTICLNRELNRQAKPHGVRVRLSYGKVAEYQARGVIHFHILARLDAVNPDDPDAVLPPPPCLTSEHLGQVISEVASRIGVRTPPHPANRAGWHITWGRQLDVKPIRSSPAGEITDTTVIGYMAKYATKSTEAVGGVARSLLCRSCKGTGLAGACHTCGGTGTTTDFRRLPVPAHARRLITAAWNLAQVPATDPNVADYWALRRSAHTLGYRGHVTTKSRRYSTTFRERRQARQSWQRAHLRTRDHTRDPETEIRITNLEYAGIGWHTSVDAQLAISAASRARAYSPLSGIDGQGQCDSREVK